IPTPSAKPEGITEGSDGALWFVESGTGGIGRIATDGTFTEYSGAGAVGSITAGSDGAIYFTSNNGGGRIDTNGNITNFNIGRCGSAFFNISGITSSPDGALWSSGPDTTINRTTLSGDTTSFSTPSGGCGAIAASPVDGTIWYLGGNKVGHLNA